MHGGIKMKFRLNGAIFFIVLIVVVVIFTGVDFFLGTDDHTSDLQSKHIVNPEAETLRAGLEVDLPPYSYIEKGELKGFYVDLLVELVHELGYNVTFVADTSEHLNDLELDLLIRPYAWLDTDQTYYLTSGINYSKLEVFSNIDQSVSTLEDLKGKTILLQKNSLMLEDLADKDINIEFVTGPSKALSLIEDGSFDFALVPKDVGHYILADKDLLNVKGNDLCFDTYTNAIGSKDDILIDRLNSELQILKLDGSHRALYDKWFKIYSGDLFTKMLDEYKILHILLMFLIVSIMVLMMLQHRCLKKDSRQIYFMNKSMMANKIRNNALIKAIPDLIFTFSLEGDILVCKAPGMNLVGKTLADLVVDDDVMAYEYLDQTIEFNRVSTFKFTYIDKDKRRFYEMRLSKCSHEEILGLARDITDEVTRDQSIDYYMYHDHLTGLKNRRYLREYFQANEGGLGFILIDIDGLKVINDSFGLEKGDALLLKVSSFISEFSDEKSFIARSSGDEFMMVFNDACEKHIKEKVKEIQVKSQDLCVDQISISISLGWALQGNRPIDECLKAAENMLHKRKIYAGPSFRSKIIDTMMSTLHESNPREEAHSKRVSDYSYKLAKALRLSEKEAEEMKLAGLLHDIGKIAVQNRVVNKIGKLSEEEYVEMKLHAEKGYRILSSIENMGDIAIFIKHHHERFDGAGYPSGLKGNQIPLYSRIITIADSYDAMISERPYKEALSRENGIKELRKHSGSQFDPTIVEVFINQVLSDSIDLTYTESTS